MGKNSVSVAVDARPHEIIEDVYFGEEGSEFRSGPYTFTAGPPDDLLSAYLMDDEDAGALHELRAKFAWVRAGFDPEDWDEIQGRLDDPTDPLSSTHVLLMYNALMEAVTKIPPTSAASSSRARPRQAGGGKQKRKAATSGE